MNETWWVSESQLDDDQKQIIAMPIDESHLVIGPPGSGKTNLLVLRAKYLNLAGKANYNVVVFTRALREFIAAGANEYNVPSEKIVTSQQFFRDVLYQYGIETDAAEDFSEQRNMLVEKVAKTVQTNKLSGIYEAILLDEAHDYLPEEIELFSKLGKTLYAVADRRQKIYSGEEPFHVLDKIIGKNRTILKHHYRNGQKICRFADEIGRDRSDFQSISNSCNYNEKEQPSSVKYDSCGSIDKEIDLVITRLEGQLKAYPYERMGIISPSKEIAGRVWERLRQSVYSDLCSFHGEKEIVNFDSSKRIIISSLHASKGLEYRVLHIVGAEKFAKRPLPRFLAYTAVTRAKTALYIYGSGELLGFLAQAMQSLEPEPPLPSVDDVFQQGGL